MQLDPNIQSMLDLYKDSSLSLRDKLREILQQCALLGLHKRHFFQHAVFYGGTALRILYGLDRFSEDLDFSLQTPNPHFDLTPYLMGLEEELGAMGFEVQIAKKEKTTQTPILSAFLKANTHILILNITQQAPQKVHFDEKLKIKLEIDTNPPYEASIESKLVFNPYPFYVPTYSLSDLFAGKMHAILCRGYKQNVKGRDWYDLIWYVKKGVVLNLQHLDARMRQSGHLNKDENLTDVFLCERLRQHIEKIQWSIAIQDVLPFVTQPEMIQIWSKQFFLDMIPKIKFNV